MRTLCSFFSLTLLAAVVHSAAAVSLAPLHAFRHRDVSRVALSPDGGTLATGGGEWATADCVRLWDTKTGKLRHTLRDSRDDGEVVSIAFAPDGCTVAYGCESNVRLWSVATGRLIRVLSGDLVGDIQISPHDRLLVSASMMSEDGIYSPIQVWDIGTGRRRVLPESEDAGVVTFSPDGQRLIGVLDVDDQVHPSELIWNAGTGELKRTRRLPVRTVVWGFSADARLFATAMREAGSHQAVSVWDARTGQRLLRLPSIRPPLHDVAFSPRAPWMVTISGGDQPQPRSRLGLWDRRTGRLLCSTPFVPGPFASAKFSADGSLLASAGGDGAAHLWRVH